MRDDTLQHNDEDVKLLIIPLVDQYYNFTRDPKKNKRLQWVKFPLDLIDNYEVNKLADIIKFYLHFMVLLYIKNNGFLPNDPSWICTELHIDNPEYMNELEGAIQILIDKGLMSFYGEKVKTDIYNIYNNTIIKDKEDNPELKIKAQKIIDHFNNCAGKKRKVTPPILKTISARLRDGYEVEDFQVVNEFKTKEWKDNEKMRNYIDPDVYYASKHFDKYLNQAKQSTKVQERMVI